MTHNKKATNMEWSLCMYYLGYTGSHWLINGSAAIIRAQSNYTKTQVLHVILCEQSVYCACSFKVSGLLLRSLKINILISQYAVSLIILSPLKV